MELLFAEIACIHLAPQETTATASPATPLRFIDLPVELRVIVNGYFVVVGSVFFHPEQDSVYNARLVEGYEEYPAPGLTILRVSKAIHSEAEALYLSMNTFVLPSKRHVHPPTSCARVARTGFTGRILFSKSALKVTHIRLGLDSVQGYEQSTTDSTSWAHVDYIAGKSSGSGGTFDRMTKIQRLGKAHHRAHNRHFDRGFACQTRSASSRACSLSKSTLQMLAIQWGLAANSA
jgi:hypothetical protein